MYIQSIIVPLLYLAVETKRLDGLPPGDMLMSKGCAEQAPTLP